MLWIILLLLTALVAFVIVQPFFRAYADDGGIEETDYLAAQLLEIDRDLDAGVLTAGEAEAARQEARRRLLAQARRSDEGARLLSPMARQAGVIAAAAAPIAALALYAALGAPDFKASPPGPAAVASGAAPPAAGTAWGKPSTRRDRLRCPSPTRGDSFLPLRGDWDDSELRW
ncbi:MAG: c-type cytochrome biogenesis protein CcmI, partial [Pseudomonadota bacterium]